MTGGRAWLALVDEQPGNATATATVQDLRTGERLGWLAAWLRAGKPVRHALRADPAAFDPDGPGAVASLVLIDPARQVIFDDSAVQRARQIVLGGGPWTAVTTLVADTVHLAGALVAAAGVELFEDPFRLVAPGRRLRVGPGLLHGGPLRLPAPVVERYAGQPWPQSGF
jgi:hypothetical protein